MKRNAMNDKPEQPHPPREPSGPESGALIEPPDEAVVRLEGGLADMKDRYLRLAAEYDNFKRRSAKERTVGAVLQPGYRMGDALIRPARVVVLQWQGGETRGSGDGK